MEEEIIYTAEEHAYSVLHAAYPDAPLMALTEAVMTEWTEGNTDDENVSACCWLSYN